MDPFHTRLAHIALQAAGSYGFALAAGAEAHVASAVDAVIAAYRHEGIHVDTDMRTASFARLNVTFSAENAKVELGVDWCKEEPIQMAVGPVLHVDDATDHDPGFDGLLFADALAAIDRLPDALFRPYGLNSRDVDALKIRMNEWAGRIRTGRRG